MNVLSTIAYEKSKFSIIQAADFANQAPMSWWIKGVFPQAELVVVFGESGAGKSFVLIDTLLAVARGIPWRGLPTKSGRVVYVCAEGEAGFRLRLSAYATFFNVDMAKLPFGVISGTPNLLENDDLDIASLIAREGGADIIVFDTLAQSTPGVNENSSEGIGRALAHCKRLHKSTGALIILVAHSGKNAARGVRGWSGIKAAADAQIEIVRGSNQRTIIADKQKDACDGVKFNFRLNQVQLGIDADGDPVTSCVVEHVGSMQTKPRQEPRNDRQKLVLEVIKNFKEGGSSSVAYAAIVQQCINHYPRADSGSDNRRRDFERAINSLQSSGFLTIIDNLVSLS
jgi:hypothetical protein